MIDRKEIWRKVRAWLSSLSFRTGVWVAAICVACYAVSFAQMLLPIPAGAKMGLWVLFFGLAKTAQYTALLIFGKAGVERLRGIMRGRKRETTADAGKGRK